MSVYNLVCMWQRSSFVWIWLFNDNQCVLGCIPCAGCRQWCAALWLLRWDYQPQHREDWREQKAKYVAGKMESKTWLNIGTFLFFFLDFRLSVLVIRFLNVCVYRLRLPQPRARSHIKVDNSSRWLTSAEVWAGPTEWGEWDKNASCWLKVKCCTL